eukprot:ANDGO_06553.mRNA.1 Eukaryotic translation initiation factor 3 subunit A
MSSTIENQFSHAKNLSAVGNHAAALDVLRDILAAPKVAGTKITGPRISRKWDLRYEEVAMFLVELSVELRKSKAAKDGLTQFRNVCQAAAGKSNQQPYDSFAAVLTRFISLAEDKLKVSMEELAKLGGSVLNPGATLITEDADEDADDDSRAYGASPESLIVSITGDVAKEKFFRETLNPVLKYVRDVYSVVLDVIKTNAPMWALYVDTVHRMFRFCTTYNRRTDFRKLCEKLHDHLRDILSRDHPAHENRIALFAGAFGKSDVAKDQEMLAAFRGHLHIRYEQFALALRFRMHAVQSVSNMMSAKKKYKPTAFSIVEDIFRLIGTTKRRADVAPHREFLKNLAVLFAESRMHEMHAFVAFRIFQYSQSAGVSQDQVHAAAEHALQAVLAVPVSFKNSQQSLSRIQEPLFEYANLGKQRNERIASVMGLSKVPKRDQLLSELVNRNVLSYCSPELVSLYRAMETHTCAPRDVAAEVAQYKAKMIAAPLPATAGVQTAGGDGIPVLTVDVYALLLQQLCRTALARLLQHLSRSFECISIRMLEELTSSWMPVNDVERELANAVLGGELDATIDHVSRCVTFSASCDDGAGASHIRSQLGMLQHALEQIFPIIQAQIPTLLAPVVVPTLPSAEILKEEHAQMLARPERIAELKLRSTTLKEDRRRAEEDRKTSELREKAEEERRQLAEREERYKRQQEEARAFEARLQEMAQKLAAHEKLNAVELPDLRRLLLEQKVLISDEDIRVGVQQTIDKQREDKARRVQEILTRIEYEERALRDAQAPKIAEWQSAFLEKDRKRHETLHTLQSAIQQALYKHRLEEKTRTSKCFGAMDDFRSRILAIRERDFERAKRDQQDRKIRKQQEWELEVAARRDAREAERKADEERKRREEERMLQMQQEDPSQIRRFEADNAISWRTRGAGGGGAAAAAATAAPSNAGAYRPPVSDDAPWRRSGPAPPVAAASAAAPAEAVWRRSIPSSSGAAAPAPAADEPPRRAGAYVPPVRQAGAAESARSEEETRSMWSRRSAAGPSEERPPRSFDREGGRDFGNREGAPREGGRDFGNREGAPREGGRDFGNREGAPREGGRDFGNREGAPREGGRDFGNREGAPREGGRDFGNREGAPREDGFRGPPRTDDRKPRSAPFERPAPAASNEGDNWRRKV